MFQTCRISWQDVTRSDKYSELSYVVFSWSCTLIPRRLRARHHISAKNTFSILCAGAHKMLEIRQPGSEGGAKLSFVPTPIQSNPVDRLSNGSRTSNSLQIRCLHHQFPERLIFVD